MSPAQAEGWLRPANLIRYFVYALLGPGLPMVIALFTMPKVIGALGAEKFGLLSLAWVVLGYFSFFDLGFGRAAVRLFAEKTAAGEVQLLRAIVATTLVLTLGLGWLGGILLAVFAPLLVTSVFHVSTALEHEAIKVLYLLAVSVPVVALGNTLKGIIEAQQNFRLSNYVQALSGGLVYLGPWLVLQFEGGLLLIVLFLVLARAATMTFYFARCWMSLPSHGGASLIELTLVPRLWHMGSWMTASNIIAPIIVYIDRFIIGSVLGVSLVTYYSTPADMAWRMGVITTALGQVLFPAMASYFYKDRSQAIKFLNHGHTAAFFIMLFPVLICVYFSQEIMTLWLGADFSARSHVILQLVALGLFVNSFAQMNFFFIQSAEKTKWTALLHMSELVLSVGLTWWVVGRYGIIGAGIVWTLRIVVDWLAMHLMVKRLAGGAWESGRVVGFASIGVVALTPAFFGLSLFWRATVAAIFLSVLSFAVARLARGYWPEIKGVLPTRST